MTNARSQPRGDSPLSVEDQMMLDAVLIDHLKARVAELEGVLRSAASYMPGRMEGCDCSSCKATEIVESALSHAGPVARDGER